MRLLLIEDDATIARELTLRWQARGWAVVGCASLGEAQPAWVDGGYDVIVLDRALPDGDGLQWLQALRRVDRRTPVLMITAMDRVADRVQGLRLGADDYLVKPFAVEELDARIQSLMRMNTLERCTGGEGSRRFGSLDWLEPEGRVLVHGRQVKLMPREFEVLGLLMRCAPRVLARHALVAALARRNDDVGDAAVEVYISRLRNRLAGSGATIQTARGLGYRLVMEDGAEGERCQA